MRNIGFIGAGKVGFSLGKYLTTRGAAVAGYYDPDRQAAAEAARFTGSSSYGDMQRLVRDAELIFLTVPDGRISQVFRQLRAESEDLLTGKILCHCSGSMSSGEAFDGIEDTGAFGYSVHPLFAVSDRFETYKELGGAFFSLEGDPSHLNDMAAFLKGAGLTFQIIDPAAKTKYHLAAVVASNLICGLIGQAEQLLRECGFAPEDALKALSPLIEGNVEHALATGPVQALTGPVERGDVTTLRKHLSVCDSEDDRQLYRLLSRKLLMLAKEKHPGRDYNELETFLNGEQEP